MLYEMLKEELVGLPDDKIMILVEFARFLKQSVSGAYNAAAPAEVHSSHKRQLGSLAQDFVSIAPDFDTCLEGMEDYL